MHSPQSHPKRVCTIPLCRNFTLLLGHQPPRPSRPEGREGKHSSHLRMAPTLRSLGGTAGRAQLETREEAIPIRTTSCPAASLFPPPCSASDWLLPRSPLTASHPPNYTHPHIQRSTLGSSLPKCFPTQGSLSSSSLSRTCLPQK